MCDTSELQDLMDDWHAGSVTEALLDAYAGATNGFLSQVCEALTGRRIEVIGEAAVLFPCPCCGRRTLAGLFGVDEGGWDICDYCFWEDDGTVDPEAHSSCNRGTMVEYRARMREETNYYFREKWSA